MDDNATSRRIDRRAVHGTGDSQTVSVATPHEALDCLRQQRFDVAVIDFDMPDMNGLELAQRVADLGLAPDMRIILSSSVREQYKASAPAWTIRRSTRS